MTIESKRRPSRRVATVNSIMRHDEDDDDNNLNAQVHNTVAMLVGCRNYKEKKQQLSVVSSLLVCR